VTACAFEVPEESMLFLWLVAVALAGGADLATADTVHVLVEAKAARSDDVAVEQLLQRLLRSFGLVVVPASADADVELVVELTIRDLGKPVSNSTARPDHAWQMPRVEYLAYTGAAVFGRARLAGKTFRFRGDKSPPNGPQKFLRAPHADAVNPWVGNALMDSQLLENVALVLAESRGTEGLVRAKLEDSWFLSGAASKVLDRFLDNEVQPSVDVEHILGFLDSRSEVQRRSAIELLDQLEPEWKRSEEFRAVVLRLIEVARRGESGNRANAIRLLSGVEDPQTAELLVPLLEDPDRRVRTIPLVVLNRLGDARVVEPLILLAESDANGSTDVGEWAQHAAVVALGDLGDPRASEALVRRIPDEVLGVSAMLSLGRTGDLRAVGPLLGVLDERYPKPLERRAAAAIALAGLGEPTAVEPILANLPGCWADDDHREGKAGRDLVDALVTLGDARAVPTLFAHAEKCRSWNQSNARATYVRALGAFPPDEDVEDLLRSLAKHSESGFVRELAAESLRAIAQRRATAVDGG
jgi:HEAT repeat protein